MICEEAFYECKNMTQVIFDYNSTVREIRSRVFWACHYLSSLRFEDGSRLSRVGHWASSGTKLTPENVKYPDTLVPEKHG